MLIHNLRLQNFGRTCYLNSVLQCLRYTHQLNNLMIELFNKVTKIHETDGDPVHKQIVINYLQVASIGTPHEANVSGTPAFDNHTVYAPFGLKHWLSTAISIYQGHNEQDAHELLVNILDVFHQVYSCPVLITETGCPVSSRDIKLKDSFVDYVKFYGNTHSIVVDLFMGQFINIVACLSCGHKVYRYDPCTIFELPIAGTNLQDCLENYLDTEKIEYKCDRCNSTDNIVKKLAIWKMPKVLVVKLNRFTYDMKKITTKIQFPHDLSLQPYIDADATPKDAEYQLYATICHTGAYGGGHYYAIVNTYDDQTKAGAVFLFNDNNYQVIDPLQMSDNPDTYMAFYRQQNLN